MRFRLDIRKRLFTQKVGGHRIRFAREVVVAPSLPVFKKVLDNTHGLTMCVHSQDSDFNDPFWFLPTLDVL